MRKQNIASEYAQALFDLAVEYKKNEVIMQQFGILVISFRETKDIMFVFGHPGIPIEEKIKVLEKIGEESNIDDLLGDFLKLLIYNGRIDNLELIYKELEQLEYKRTGKEIIIAESSIELDDEDKVAVKEKFSKLLDKKIELKTRLNPSLLAGLRITYDSIVYDTSIKNQLDNLRRSI